MIIPKRVQIAGLNIDVAILPSLYRDKGLGGHLDYAGQRILLAGDVHEEMQEVTLIHEILHLCLFVMGESELRDNEKFVDLLAHLLHQSLKTTEK